MEPARSVIMSLRSLLLALVLINSQAFAQSYPSRPITLIVPFAPGGPTDTLARIISEPMKAFLGQPIVIEHVSGAAGSVAGNRVARAAADGYTLAIGQWTTHV